MRKYEPTNNQLKTGTVSAEQIFQLGRKNCPKQQNLFLSWYLVEPDIRSIYSTVEREGEGLRGFLEVLTLITICYNFYINNNNMYKRNNEELTKVLAAKCSNKNP